MEARRSNAIASSMTDAADSKAIRQCSDSYKPIKQHSYKNMDTKNRLETLVSLRDQQLELVLSREAGLRVLQKMDPTRVLTTTPDLETMQPKVVTAGSRLKEMRENLEVDQMRLEAYDEMIKEETKKEEGSNRTPTEKE